MRARVKVIAREAARPVHARPALLRDALAPWKAHVLDWLALEAERGRLFIALPVAFGLGTLLYFAAPDEPSWAAAVALVAGLSGLTFAVRHRFAWRCAGVLASLVALGFAVPAVRTATLVQPQLPGNTPAIATVTAHVETVERRERDTRLTLRVLGSTLDPFPGRIRVTTRAPVTAVVGATVTARVRLMPPAQPVLPGAYDHAREAYFAGIGAVGTVLGRIEAADTRALPPGLSLKVAVEAVRTAISERIRAAIPGSSGAIADALVTGNRGGIPTEINDAMRVAGLYHILSISGFHMALVGAFVFGAIRGLFALVPALVLHYPIKRYAAAVAFAVTTGYLALSGAEVATQRAWVMIAIVLIGVMIGRPALTLRTLALAALVVLTLTPESLLGPSFQMSFAAALALVAGYGAIRPVAEAHAGDHRGWRGIVLAGTQGLTGLALSSFVASVATAPYAAHHFHVIQLYGVPGNLIGAPIVELFVMPLEVIALLLWPLGWDAPIWALVGRGVDLFVAAALWIASWPGGVVSVPARPSGVILLFSTGFLVLALLSTPLRWLGVPCVALAAMSAWIAPRPVIQINATGDTILVRGADGELHALGVKATAFAMSRMREADGRRGGPPASASGPRCDSLGCVIETATGVKIAVSHHFDGVDDDCREAQLVIAPSVPPGGCTATVLALSALPWYGAVSATLSQGNWIITSARHPRGQRPWQPRRPADAAPELITHPGHDDTSRPTLAPDVADDSDPDP